MLTSLTVWMAPRMVVAFLLGTLLRSPLTTPALIVACCRNDAVVFVPFKFETPASPAPSA
jgi:hypothetical protein